MEEKIISKYERDLQRKIYEMAGKVIEEWDHSNILMAPKDRDRYIYEYLRQM